MTQKYYVVYKDHKGSELNHGWNNHYLNEAKTLKQAHEMAKTKAPAEAYSYDITAHETRKLDKVVPQELEYHKFTCDFYLPKDVSLENFKTALSYFEYSAIIAKQLKGPHVVTGPANPYADDGEPQTFINQCT